MTSALKRLLALLLVVVPALVPLPARAAQPLPSRSAVLADATRALDGWYSGGGGSTSAADWQWAVYYMGLEAVYRQAPDAVHRQRLQDWGDRNGWDPTTPTSPTSDPDGRAALQVWQDAADDGLAVDLGPADPQMAVDLSAPASTYWWVDALFMGLPLWTRWAARTGDPAYAAHGSAVYANLRDSGATPYRRGCADTGLLDSAQDLWWRDCSYVGSTDSQGHEVLWARGNGWVLGALARTLMVLPADDPARPTYVAELQRMSARLAALQGDDGLWRSSLLSPSLFPTPETSSTALFTYAMAYGVRTGLLDRATYLPVLQRAWAGLTGTALQADGSLTGCQGVGEAPGGPGPATPYCVGAFALAASEVAQLTADPGTLAVDSFRRSVQGGLGGAWTLTGPASAYAVSGGRARLTTPAGTTVAASLPVRSAALQVAATVGTPVTRRGSTYVALLGRQVGAASYAARLVVAPSSSGARLQLQRSGTTLAEVALPSCCGPFRLRLQVLGTSPTILRAQAWSLGATAPSTWQVTATDSTAGLQLAGGVGVTTYLSAGASPSSTVVTLDDLRAATIAAP